MTQNKIRVWKGGMTMRTTPLTCKQCEYYEEEWDELTYNTYYYCIKGHGNFKGFPYQKECKCFKQSSLSLYEEQQI